MEASTRIKEALARVSELREMAARHPTLSNALADVKAIQAKRFTATYGDLLESQIYSGCATFFLEELYSERDYSQRDAQFAKVAATIQHTFPAQVVDIAITLAELHQATEELDLAMGKNWMELKQLSPVARYQESWRRVGQRSKREWQLATVLRIGRELGALTSKRGLRWLLKMMHKPAELAGLGDLQKFLETGFKHFSNLAKDPDAVDQFLLIIQKRERKWINELFDSNSEIQKAKNAQSSDWAFKA